MQGLLSSQLPVLTTQPTLPLQASGVHGLPSLQLTTPLAVQTRVPLGVWQLSPVVQALPSLQGAPAARGAWPQLVPVQLSVVHGLLSSQPSWALATQVAAPCCIAQRSGPEQALPSSQ